MPFSASWKGLFFTRIETRIPRKWKHVKQLGAKRNQLLELDDSRIALKGLGSMDELMVYPLLASLREFIGQRNLRDAFNVFSSIQHHVTFTGQSDVIIEPISSLLVACSDMKSIPQGEQLHAQIIHLGFDQHCLLLRKLVTMYSTFNQLSQAHLLVESASVPQPLIWNVVISAYIKNGLTKQALNIYKQMLKFGVRPDEFTYPSILKACGEQKDLAFGREIHECILASTSVGSLHVQNALISMYGKCGEIEVARDLFNKLPSRDACSWNSMIWGYASKRMWEEAFMLFEQMLVEGVQLNIITWNTIIGGCLQMGNYEGVLRVLSQMRLCLTHLDAVSMASGLSACSHVGAMNIGKEIHAFAIRVGCDKFLTFQNALVTMYTRCEGLRHAHIVFRQIEEKDIISWNSIISGYAHFHKSEDASFLFREMLLGGCKPNNVTVASIISLCARVANLQHGRELHCYVIKHQILDDYLQVGNALVHMYARAGKVSDANRVFDLLTGKDVVTYTSLITGYGILGEGHIALKLFEEMERFAIKPDHITMVAVLSACSHSGLVIQGQLLFEKMWREYRLSPSVEHYACMVDLFGRAGLLKKAEEIIRRMPYEPSADIWATLLGACRIHRNTDLGQLAADKLLALRPCNSGYYVLIANMYASAECWSKLAEVRTIMRNLGLLKPPGSA